MASPRKALLTIHVGDEQILIPFRVDLTVGDLLAEVHRRTADELGLRAVSGLRARSPEGPRLFDEDLVDDIVPDCTVLYAISVGSLLHLPTHPTLPFEGEPEDETSPVPGGREKPPDEEPTPSVTDMSVAPGEPGPEGEAEDALADLPGDRDESTAARGSQPEEDGLDGCWYFQARPASRPQATCKSPVRASQMASHMEEAALRWLSSRAQDMGADAKPGGGGASGPAADCVIEQLSDRRVEWVIRDIAAKLQEFPKGSRMLSPDFAAFGIAKLGLVLYPNGNSNAKPGYCSLGLKAPHGCHLRYKLYVSQTEKYTELRQNVTESWGFVDMCRVEEECDKVADTLRLGVEIIDDIDQNEELVEVLPTKIEWSIRNMASKLAYYRKDIALYSSEFTAGGVEKLRLKLYPNGKKEAEDGWCSLYLEAPKGSELRCRLSVGKKSMSFDRLEKFGEDSIWGFLTLCSLQEEVEMDTVKVGLEVLETKRLDQRLSEVEDLYLKSLGAEKRGWLLDELQRVESIRASSDGGVPSRFRILQMELPDSAKAVALQRLETLNTDQLSAEATKLKRWIDGLLNIPFGKIQRPVVSIGEGQEAVAMYLQRAEAALHQAVFGHTEPKEKIVQLLCQWISNPDSMSLVLGIQGPPGNGKTTLCRQGIAEALGRPFAQISLGGATDASVLEGHSYTYVGSTWGRIVGLLTETQCMNPVMFFDELDKVSETPRGEEICGVLTHLTDHSQNSQFTDKYFDGIPLDMSKALFVFSFNDESKLNSVLRDRLTIVKTKGFNQQEQLQIAQKYLLPDLLRNVGMGPRDVRLADGVQGVQDIAYLCDKWGVPDSSRAEGGVRGLQQALEAAVLHINKLRVLHTSAGPPQVEAEKKEEERAGEKAEEAPADAGSRPLRPSEDEKVAPAERGDGGRPPTKTAALPASRAGKAGRGATGPDRRSSCAVPERSPPGESDPREPPAESRERPGSARLGEEDGSEAEKTEEEEELPKFKKAPFELQLPLTLTKEIIDQLLPFDRDRDTRPNLYI